MIGERIGAAPRVAFRALPAFCAAPVRAGYRGVLADEGAVGIAEQRNVGHRQRAQRLAVVAVLQADELRLLRSAVVAPVVGAHLQRDFGGGGAVRTVEAMP